MVYYLKRFYLIFLVCLLFSCGNKGVQDYINEGIKYTEEQKYDKAMTSFKKAIEADPSNAHAHYTLGGIYTFKDMNQKAMDEYKMAIELDRTYPDPHYSLGFVYDKMGMKEKAKQEYLLFDGFKSK
ncbi:MAG: tetratricopeptide repeat protein [Candidatus Anammoxibacter sp.]